MHKLNEAASTRRTISPQFWNRRWRIALEILGPAPIGVLVLVVATGIRTIWMRPESWVLAMNSLADLPLMILFAYFFVGIQSLVYMAVLEWSFSRGLNPASGGSVGLSTLLGLVSGVAIVAASGFDRADVIESLITLGGTGVAVGLILGVLIKFLSKN